MTLVSHTVAKLAKAARLATRPIWRRGLLHGVAATVEHLPLAKLVVPDTVVDVGANKGQFSLFALQIWPDCRVIAFEPLPNPAARYRKMLSGHPRARLVEAAIGPAQGTAEIHLSEREDSSSLLPIGERMAGIFPQATSVGRTVTVKIGSLDCFVSEHELLGRVLLKLDVQGFELEALRGCESLLRLVQHIYVECSYVELYRSQALIADVTDFLNGHGYKMAAEINVIVKQGIGKIQSDCLFIRPSAPSQPIASSPQSRLQPDDYGELL